MSLCAALLLSTLACSQPDTTSSAMPEESVDATTDAGPFSWPEDPSHPVLEISVESPEASGVILIELMPELAPATVVSIIELANEGFYDATTFHRVIPGFMIQGGDPKSRDRDPGNDGTGASGRRLHDEFGDAPFLRGVVGMGNKGRKDSTSTQFFIMHADNENLVGRYTAVGRVLAGMDLVDQITRSAIDRIGRWGPKDRPIDNIVMTQVRTIGQVAAIKASLEPEATMAHENRLSAADSTPPRSEPDGHTSAPPAAPQPIEDWQRLEAAGR